MNAQCGFIYVVSGEKYVREAERSAAQLKALHDLPVTLISDRAPSPEAAKYFDEVRVDLVDFDYSNKIRMRESRYDRTIFLDSDTLPIRSLKGIFQLLDTFDVAFQFTEGGNHYALPGVPPCFFEPSAGIVAWRRCAKSAEFFDAWSSAYAEIEKDQGMRGAWDQRSMRQAAFYSQVRLAPIPNEWQFYTYKPNFLAHNIHLLHGRDSTRILADQVDANKGPRVWLPRVGLVPSLEHPNLLEAAGFGLRFYRRLATRWLRLLLHRIGLWPLPKGKRPA
ncbi:hypothetical protein [Actomonas aquatica]|uniref:Nucleotide-diphospho-sugar transferase domain-containing protein n=1 Tax=Actomonas aquatica TaxID=2866162 RepID=A0ABZ1CAB0_9BACT|nr:hypothetical protein [Opitutus sp. WL0086]WRQ88461.1 hypothetical protein K1X11_003540 [Opitutus sp. WL0086]